MTSYRFNHKVSFPARNRHGGRQTIGTFTKSANGFAGTARPLVRNAKAKIVPDQAKAECDGLEEETATAIDTFTPAECKNYFAAAGYDWE